jgi:hypothetical protein
MQIIKSAINQPVTTPRAPTTRTEKFSSYHLASVCFVCMHAESGVCAHVALDATEGKSDHVRCLVLPAVV